MGSISAVLKDAIMDVMSDGKEREVFDIKKAIQEEHNMKYKVDYQEGHLAGSLRTLRVAGKLKITGRGVYKLGTGIPEPKAEKAVRVGPTAARKPLKINMQLRDPLELQEVEKMIEEKCHSEGKKTTLGQLRQEVFSALKSQYDYLVQEMETRTLSSIEVTSDLENIRKLLELKNDLEGILSKSREQ